ncbi:MAG: helicase C-terminal domain-containing protein, partial [Planctomycetota bacterium]
MDGTDGEAEFVALADPGPLAAATTELTGLRRRDVRGAPSPRAVAAELLEFCADGRLIVHDGGALTAFLGREGLEAPPCAEAASLARIVCPRASDYTLEGVAEVLGLAPGPVPRAGERARLLARVWRALMREAAQLAPAALDAICRVAEAAGDPLAPFLAAVAAGAGEFKLSADPDRELAKLFADHRDLLRRVPKHEPGEPGNEPVPTEGICRMLSPAGLIGRRLPNYEHRAEQVAMLRAVCDALNGPHHLVAEAGTGTGKSLAYLLPAIAWACTNNDKVVVSTNTKNLQEQLYGKDLPFLVDLLPGRFEPALLKGRRNYLCVRRFLHLMRHFDRELAEPEEMMALAPLLSWAGHTESGDLAECNGFQLSPAAPSVIQAVTTGPEECAGRMCRYRRRCFVLRARALAQLADLIVVNHALLFAELSLDSPVLPPYRCVVFDEAHNLEEAATEAFATVVDGIGTYRITNLLYRKRRDGSGSGLLATAMHEAGKAARDAQATDAGRSTERIGAAASAVDEVVEAARQFFEVLGQPFAELPRHVDRALLPECCPPLGPGSAAWDAAQVMRSTVGVLGERIELAAKEIESLGGEPESMAELAEDLRSQVGRLRELCAAAEFVLAQEDEGYVYWVERTRRDRRSYYSIHAAPLRVGDHIREFFFRQRRTVVLTSATLQVGGRFDYVLESLGADQLPPGSIRCESVGSPFDYDRQALVGVATFLPDPGGRRDRTFDEELSSFLIDLLERTRGRALVLFTSYSLLDAVYERIKEPLQRSGIAVLAQGHSGSREAITSLFRRVTASVLLGTRSFWEGVDISGETLSCLVLTKLPFHVFTDPLVRGRTEYMRELGRDPFTHYTLPEAVTSFRQG